MRMRRLPYLLLKVGCLVCLFSLFIFGKIADRAENKKLNDSKGNTSFKTGLSQEKTLQTKKIYNEKPYMPSFVKSGDKIDSHLSHKVAQSHSETVQEEAYQTDEDPDKVRYHKGRILVKFNTQEEEQLRQGKDLNLSGTIGRMATKGGFHEVIPNEGETVEELLEKYRIDFSHMVQYAQLDYECEIQGRDEPYLKRFKKNIKGLKNKKSKELEELIWYMDAINIAEAWKKTSGEKSVVIALLDTGIAFEEFIVPEYEAETVDSDHYLEIPYLTRTRIWQNEAEKSYNEKDDDNNGYMDDKHGYDFVNKDVHPNDNNGHGTHLANIIGHDFSMYNNLNLNDAGSKYKAKLGQKMNKDIGLSSSDLDYTGQIEDIIYGNSKTDKNILAGIAPKCTIMNLKVLNYKGKGFSSNIAEAIYYAVDNGAHVINLSFAWPPNLNPGPIIHDAIIYAANAGVIIVSGSGNNSRSTVCYPAAYEEVIAVGSIQYDYSRACYSNYGHELEIVAPGGNIWEDQNLDDFPDGVLTQTFEPRYRFSVDGEILANPSRFMFDFIHGTSVATAQVTGIVALLLSVKPELSLANIRSLISGCALDLGPAGWDPEYGYGLINAGKAVKKAINGDYDESPVDNNKGNDDEYDDYIIDTDDDGYSSILEGGNDCNDYDSAIYPGAAEVPYDGIDQNCDGRDLADVDNDGYNSVEVGGTDCDDHNMAIHPGAPEVRSDGIDQDCDGDDNTSTSVYWVEDPDSCDGMGWEGDCDSCSSEYEIEMECPEF